MSSFGIFGNRYLRLTFSWSVAVSLATFTLSSLAEAQAVGECDHPQTSAITAATDNETIGGASGSIWDASKHDGTSSAHEPILAERIQRTDRNRQIYYKNKLEFSLELGYLPKNIPFVFNFATGDPYSIDDPLRYTLIPVIASLRWQPDNVAGPLFLRGNWDLSFSVAITPIVRGPEAHYLAYVMGVRRNFVYRNSKITPYLDGRVGVGHEDATGPKGVLYGQGQDLAFTVMLGGGIRYNLNSRYSFSVGPNYMHISNLYMSEPRYWNWGINVLGAMIGIDISLHPHRHHTIASSH